jgi:choline dehydrogenase-like flavoprotein
MAPLLVNPGNREVFPDADVVQTDEDILNFAGGNIVTIWHAAGTCKTGSDDDEFAVLDSKARVRGVNGLRVVDASAFPILPPGHPQATIYALAEKIAADILSGGDEQ